jgi:hypothetical protein
MAMVLGDQRALVEPFRDCCLRNDDDGMSGRETLSDDDFCAFCHQIVGCICRIYRACPSPDGHQIFAVLFLSPGDLYGHDRVACSHRHPCCDALTGNLVNSTNFNLFLILQYLPFRHHHENFDDASTFSRDDDVPAKNKKQKGNEIWKLEKRIRICSSTFFNKNDVILGRENELVE